MASETLTHNGPTEEPTPEGTGSLDDTSPAPQNEEIHPVAPHAEPTPEQPQPEALPPPTITAEKYGKSSPKTLTSPEEPFYAALDEDTIRAQIVELLGPDKDEKLERSSIFYRTTGLKVGDQSPEANDTRVHDVDKALAMALVENNYWEQAKAKWDEMEDVLNDDGGESLRKLLNPFRFARQTFRYLKLGGQLDMIGLRAGAAIEVAGQRFDTLLAAASPYIPKLPETTEFLSKLPLAKPTTEADAEQTDEAAVEKLVEDLKLDKQLAEQAAIWSQAGLLKPLGPEGTLGIVTADGQECPMPSRRLVRDMVAKQAELIRYKASHGFTRMILVPNGATLAQFNEAVMQQAVAQYHANNLHTDDNKPVYLTDSLTSTDRQKELTRDLARTQEKEAEKSAKKQAKDSKDKEVVPGWEIIFVRNMPEIARRREDLVYMGDQPEFLPGGGPAGYQKLIDEKKELKGEAGLSLKEWYAYALTEVARTGRLVDFQGRTFLLGSEEPDNALGRVVLSVGWNYRGKNIDPRLVIENIRFKTKRGLPEEGIRTAVALRP